MDETSEDLSKQEEGVVYILSALGVATAPEISEKTDLSTNESRKILSGLEDRGYAKFKQTDRQLWTATTPTYSIMTSEQREALEEDNFNSVQEKYELLFDVYKHITRKRNENSIFSRPEPMDVKFLSKYLDCRVNHLSMGEITSILLEMEQQERGLDPDELDGKLSKTLRKEHDIKQLEIAGLLGTSQARVSQWERGNTQLNTGEKEQIIEFFTEKIADDDMRERQEGRSSAEQSR